MNTSGKYYKHSW